MTAMEEIIALETTKRWPPREKLDIPRCVAALAKTLSAKQVSLLAEVVRTAEELDDFDVLRQCLISPATYSEDLRQARWAMHRHQDGILRSS